MPQELAYHTEDTDIIVLTREDPIPDSYYLAQEIDGEALYVNRKVGTKATLVLRNVSSLSGLEIGIIISGRRTK